MIEVHDLTKKYGGVTAVNSISFDAKPGQVTGFLGPNGAGKTTTMRMLTGFLPPTSGRAVVAGFDVFEQSMEVRKRVGYLPESVPLYRDMSAIGYLKYLGEIRGLGNREERAHDALERVGLTGRANSRIRTLSKGMRQRVGLASALLHDPEVLILDEPTIGLDPLQVLELRELVRELGKNHTVLFSTHILSEAEQVCDNVVIINQGEIVAQGSPSQLLSELESGRSVIVRADAPLDDLLSLVQTVPTISQAEIGLSGNNVMARPSSPNIDPRPDIARAIIERGWNLVEIRSSAVTLEDIFLEVTAQASEKQAETEETTEDTVTESEAVNE